MLSQLCNDDLYLLLLIRHFEKALLQLFSQARLNGTTHTCLGQEYIPVALKALLTPEDMVLSNHRGHGHYLARFEDPAGLLAEIMGRQGAVCRGVGGSQHIYREQYLSTGIQGESLPIAVGIALHLKREGKQQLSIVHIGDGTWGEGVVYEALNIAQLWLVPLVVIVENNHIAQTTPIELQMAGSIQRRAEAFGIEYHFLSSLDIGALRQEIAPWLQNVRQRPHPLILEFDTPRLGPHSKGDDTRNAAALQEVQERDWYRLYSSRFPQQFEHVERLARNEVESVIREVEGRSLSAWEAVC